MGIRQRLAERWIENPPEPEVVQGHIDSIQEAIKDHNMDLLKETVQELELELLQNEDLGWIRLTGSSEDWEFSTYGRQLLNELAHSYWMKNPLAGRAVATKTHYTFGRGVTVTGASDEVQEVISGFWDDDDNKAILTRHQAQQFKSNELQVYGNVFLVLFANQVNGHIKLGDIPDKEITDIIRDKENRHKPRYYKRQLVLKDYNFDNHVYLPDKSDIWYYPDWKSDDIRNASKGTGNGVVYHLKVNCLSDSKFGISELYRAIDWLKAYNKFLENWASITAAFARFAWKKKIKGGSANVLAEKLRTQSGFAGGAGLENNPPGAAGSMWIENMGTDLQPIRTQGATTSAADGRFLKLMVCAASGIFEHYFGDPSTGNLATATAMELPMLKMFESDQQLWQDAVRDIIQLEIDNAVGYGRIRTKKKEDLQFEVQMPPIITKDVPAMIGAIVEAVNLGAGGNTNGLLPMETATRLVLNTLGVKEPEKIIADMYEKNGGKPTPKQEKEFVAEVKKMSESLDQILESAA